MLTQVSQGEPVSFKSIYIISNEEPIATPSRREGLSKDIWGVDTRFAKTSPNCRKE